MAAHWEIRWDTTQRRYTPAEQAARQQQHAHQRWLAHIQQQYGGRPTATASYCVDGGAPVGTAVFQRGD